MAADKSPLSLIDSLDEKAYSASIIATYNAYLPFYEQVVLRRLLAAGCSHNIVLMDAAQCAAALACDELRPRLAGSDYVLVPVSLKGAFHPKVFLRLGRKKGSLYVGSHNLTVGGFGLNDELTNLFRHEGAAGEEVQSFNTVLAFLRAHLPGDLTQLREAFDSAVQVAPWLRSPSPVSPTVRVLCMQVGEPDLWSQLRPLIRGNVRRAFVMAPFFDSGLQFVSRLIDDVKPVELVVAIDPECVEIPAEKARQLRSVRFVDVAKRAPLATAREGLLSYLHAKAYWFETDEVEVLVTGSANASRPAFISPDAQRNAEVVVVRIAKAGRSLAKEIGLTDLLRLPKVSEEAWDQIAERQPRVKVPDHASPSACIAIASNSGFALDRPVEAGATITILDRDGRSVGSATIAQSVPWAELVAPAEYRESACILEIAQGGAIFRAIVHHPLRIAELYATDTRRALRQALGTIDDDPSQLELLLKLSEKVIFDDDTDLTSSVSPSGSGKNSKKGKKPEPEAASPDSLAVDAQGKRSSAHRRKSIASGDITVLLDALIRRLGEGLLEPRLPSGPNEEEKIGSDDETEELPPPPDLPRLASLCRRKVRRLLERMEKQLGLADDKPRRAIVQLAAVMSVLHRLRIIEQRPDWRQARETLIDHDDLWYFFEVASEAVGWGSESLGKKSIEQNDNEIFEEHSIAFGLLVWLAWECEPQEELDDEGIVEPVDDEELHRWKQHVVLLGAGIAEDDRAQDVAAEALNRAQRRGTDHERWLADQIAIVDRVINLERNLQHAKRSRVPVKAGDMVVLSLAFDPRLRLALRVEPGTKGPTVTVVDAEKEELKFAASFLEVLEWKSPELGAA